MKIIFAGTPEFAADSLQAIIDQGHEVIAVYTQPDRPAGRGKKLLKSEVKVVAEAHSIPVYQPEKLTCAEAQSELSALQSDLMIVAAYGLLLPKNVLEAPTYGCINIHGSLLPRWRGAAPIQRAIQANDSETGITIMQMDEGLDTGDMILKLETPISSEDTGGSLHDRLSSLGAEAILKYLSMLNDRLKGQEPPPAGEQQDSSLANYAHKLSKQEALINWHESAEQISRNIRAFNPWPVSFFEITDPQNKVLRIRVFESEVLPYEGAEKPGTIVEKDKRGIVITCGAQAIRILKLQLPGAKAMEVQAFVNGGKNLLNQGDVLDSTHD